LSLRLRVLAGALAGALVAAALRAEPSFDLLAMAASGNGFAESFASATAPARLPDLSASTLGLIALPDASAAPAVKKPKWIPIAGLSLLAIGGSYYNARSDGPQHPFHFTSEGWFGRNTYAGGGDKASHFVSYYIVGKLMSGVYQELGMEKDPAVLLGAGISALAGLATEIGDGTNKYGFSWEDITMDWLGAATSIAIAHYGLDDVMGFRAGRVPSPTAPCCPYGGTGKDYSEEIYTGDLKIAGLADRARFSAGPGRYFLFSITYSAKGYPYANPAIRERQIGFEAGINFCEILRAVGVPPDKWWSKILYFAFDVLRFPYTQIGMYYDLNNHHWYGPGIGDQWPGYDTPGTQPMRHRR
jgi:hypothetical protein